MTTQTQALVVSDEGDRRAAQLAAEGATLGQIAARYDPPLSDGAVRAAIARGRHQLSQRAVNSPKPVPLEPDELMAWAEKEGPARARLLAGRVRTGLVELAQLHEQHQATDVVRKTIAVLENQLATARADLRRMTRPKPKQQPRDVAASPTCAAPGSKEERALIRAWAREQGYPVGDVGVIGKQIVEEYRAAHAVSGAGR